MQNDDSMNILQEPFDFPAAATGSRWKFFFFFSSLTVIQTELYGCHMKRMSIEAIRGDICSRAVVHEDATLQWFFFFYGSRVIAT